MEVPSKVSKLLTLLLAVAMLVASLLVVQYLVSQRPSPQRKQKMELPAPTVSVTPVTRGTHPVRVELYGTVEAEKHYSLHAPYAGRVSSRQKWVVGDFVPAGSVLYDMETTRLDLTLGQREAKLQSLTLEEQRLAAEAKFFNDRLETLGELVQLNEAAIAKQKERMSSEEEIFSAKEQLRERETISNTSFLQAESTFRQIELNFISARNNLENNRERYHFLNQQLSSNEFARQKLILDARELQYQVADLLNDRQKAAIGVDSPGRVTQVEVDSMQEVTMGRHLATVRSTKAILLPVTLPDTYFRWLYEGELLEGGEATMEIEMVNTYFSKPFSGGSIRSIGSDLDTTTRSLPIVILRENPHSEDGLPISEQEMRPGMYCRVYLELCQLSDTFFIPHEGLQEGRRLFTVIDGKLHIINDIELLHENGSGIVVRIPKEADTLQLVTQTMRRAEEGMKVKVEAAP